MQDFVNLTCPQCGGKLQITNDIDLFACSYCGNELIVKRGGGIVSLKPVLDTLGGVKIGVDKTAAELALARLREEAAELRGKIDQIKGPSCGVMIAVAVVVFIIALFILASIRIDTNDKWEGLIVFGIPILLAVTISSWYSESQAKTADNNRKPLKEKLAEVNEEIRKHQEVVSDKNKE